MTITTNRNDVHHQDLWERALAASKAAAQEVDTPPEPALWVRTSIVVQPGTSSFARFLRRHHRAWSNRSFPRGTTVSCGSGPYQLEYAWAKAVVAVLKAEGIGATHWSFDD